MNLTLTITGGTKDMAKLFAVLASLEGLDVSTAATLPGEKPLSPDVEDDGDDATEEVQATPKRRGRPPSQKKDAAPAPAAEASTLLPQTAATASTVAATAPAPAPAPVAPTPAAAPAPAAPAWTAESVRDLMMKTIEQCGAPTVLDTLKFYKATKLAQLAPEYYSEFAGKLQKAMSDHSAAAALV
ncbi:hypothetical protein [Hyphomicrobium sp. DY-1]|uniref:hypothetical protein n=1 Tax=Hyphomicrobium sp. DY-1 TaxID=3075650 RepID=UPI0039C3EE11